MVSRARIDELVRMGDLDELLLEVDRLCAGRDWDGLVLLRDLCEAAVELGRQLWPAAQFAEYRLALEAPGRYAAAVLRPGAGRFALGPLTEVAASTHAWEELADHITEPWIAATVAQERVLRGEDLTGDDRAHPDELGLPLVLQDWEPQYPLPVYRSHQLNEGGPPPPSGPWLQAPSRAATPFEMAALSRALAEVGDTWAEQSDGDCRVLTVRGNAADAAATLLAAPVRMARIPLDQALAMLAWTAASGGAHGRRSGMAAGRSAAWWVLHAATGVPFPDSGHHIRDALDVLNWYAFEVAIDTGWSLALAVEDPEEGWAAAIHAWDRRTEDEEPGW